MYRPIHPTATDSRYGSSSTWRPLPSRTLTAGSALLAAPVGGTGGSRAALTGAPDSCRPRDEVRLFAPTSTEPVVRFRWRAPAISPTAR
jgi:hypothetical protein